MKKIISLLLIATLLLVSTYPVMAADSFNAYEKIYAADYTEVGIGGEAVEKNIQIYDAKLVEDRGYFAYTRPKDYAVFKNVDFGETGAVKFQANVTAGIAEGQTNSFDIRIDGVDGELIGTLEVKDTGGWTNWEVQETEVKTVSGVHDVYLIWDEPSNLSSFQFIPAASNPKTGDAGIAVYALVAAAAGAALIVVRKRTNQES